MAKKVSEILSLLRSASEYVLTSEYDVLWSGTHASPLNDFNDYIETVSVPGRTIQTSESVTANSIPAKVASSITFEDLEITWRVKPDFGIYYKIEDWMNAVKQVDSNGYVRTGFFDDYCKANKCRIATFDPPTGGGGRGSGGARTASAVCEIQGLYPTTMQSIQFSSEGGDYVKVSVTFTCFLVTTKDIA